MPEAPARRDETDRPAADPRPAPRSRAAAPARRPAPRSSAMPPQPGPLHRAGAILRHPAGIIGTLLGLGAVAAVATNALTFQSGRHPAPLFAKAPPAGKAPPGGEPARDGAVAARTAAKPAPDRPPAEPETAAARAPDGIGDLIRGDTHTTAALPSREPARAGPPRSDPPPASRPAANPPQARETTAPGSRPVADKGQAGRSQPAASARGPEQEVRLLSARAKPGPASASAPDKDVAFAQRALVKLGYGPLTVDGIIGPGTRAALDRFERDRRLNGVSRGTLRELAARSGLKPE
ncbi:MAG: peptidoglycan-binding protein [Methylobacterium frigidaeris]